MIVGGVAGAVILVAASRPWAAAALRTPGVPVDEVSVRGTAAAPLLSAMSFVVLASAAALLPTAGWLRRVVGGVQMAASLLAGFTAVSATGAVRAAFRSAIAASPASGAGVPGAVDVSLWRWVCVAAAVGGLAAGAAAAWRGHRWPGLGRRYEAPSRRLEADADPWRALDAGQDPTA